MLKKTLIASAALIVSGSYAFANGGTYQPGTNIKHTVYVGIAVSRDFLQSDANYFYKALNGGGESTAELGNDGWAGDLNLGIGWTLHNHYYLGAEAFGSLNDNTTVQFTTAKFGALSLKYKGSYGVDFVPGIKLNDSTMLYGKVGYVRGEFGDNYSGGAYCLK